MHAHPLAGVCSPLFPRTTPGTRPFVVEGDEVHVNAEFHGQWRVEIVPRIGQIADQGRKSHVTHYVGAGKKLFDGFRRGDCAILCGDRLSRQFRWRGATLGKLDEKTVGLMCVVQDAQPVAGSYSANQFCDHLATELAELFETPTVEVCQLVVVETQEMQQCHMYITDGMDDLDRL